MDFILGFRVVAVVGFFTGEDIFGDGGGSVVPGLTSGFEGDSFLESTSLELLDLDNVDWVFRK